MVRYFFEKQYKRIFEKHIKNKEFPRKDIILEFSNSTYVGSRYNYNNYNGYAILWNTGRKEYWQNGEKLYFPTFSKWFDLRLNRPFDQIRVQNLDSILDVTDPVPFELNKYPKFIKFSNNLYDQYHEYNRVIEKMIFNGTSFDNSLAKDFDIVLTNVTLPKNIISLSDVISALSYIRRQILDFLEETEEYQNRNFDILITKPMDINISFDRGLAL